MTFNIGETHTALLQSVNPYKIHIMAIVDGDQVVFKWYGKHKQWWHYNVESKSILGMRIERAKSNKQQTG